MWKKCTSINPLPTASGIEHEKLKYPWPLFKLLTSPLLETREDVVSWAKYFPSNAQNNLMEK